MSTLENKWLTQKEAIEFISDNYEPVAQWKIYKLLDKGALRVRFNSGGRRLYDRDSIVEYYEAQASTKVA